MHRAVPERPEAAPLALLRGPMRMICSMYAYAIIKGCFLVKKLGYSRRSCAFTAQMRPTTRRHGIAPKRLRTAHNGRQEPGWARKSDGKHVYS